ncbi:MAG: Ycf66 family protein [Thermosynechococcus sp.]
MLTNLLAWSMAIASLGLYLLGFFLPELYRRFDLVASGAGLFFALTLWIYGDRIGGGLLLGTAAAVVLILWFGWQTLSYRWQLTYPGDRTDTQKAQALWQKIQSLLPAGLFAKIGELISRLRDRPPKQPEGPQPPVETPPPPMETGDIKADLWTGEARTPSSVAPQPTSAMEEAPAVSEAAGEPAPTLDLPSEGGAETPASPTVPRPEEPQVETAAPPTVPTSEEPEPASIPASEEPVANLAEQAPPETAEATPEPAVTPEVVEEPPLISEVTPNAEPISEHTEAMPAAAAAPESPTSAADLLEKVPESRDVEAEATPEGTTIENPEPPPPEDDDWPPPEARL